MYNSVQPGNKDKVERITKALGLKILPRDIKVPIDGTCHVTMPNIPMYSGISTHFNIYFFSRFPSQAGPRPHLQAIMRQWLPLSKAVLGMNFFKNFFFKNTIYC